MFDAIVGNPPYQEELLNTSHSNANVNSIFQNFQEVADTVSQQNSLIYPGERWLLRIGRYMDEFGKEQLNSSSLHKVIHYPNSKEVFDDVWVSGGITIVFKNKKLDNSGYWEFQRYENGKSISAMIRTPGESKISIQPLLNTVIEKTKELKWQNKLSDTVRTQKFFRISSNAVELNPSEFVLCNSDFSNKPTEDNRFIRVLTNDKAGKIGKAKWFWTDRKNVRECPEIDQWKIVISSANLTGENGRTPNAEILPPKTAVGRVRIVLAAFDTEEEAKNLFKYLSTDMVRTLMTTTGNYITGFGSNVPVPGSLFNNNEDMDFHGTVDEVNEQLFSLINLTKDEKEVVKTITSQLSPFAKKL